MGEFNFFRIFIWAVEMYLKISEVKIYLPTAAKFEGATFLLGFSRISSMPIICFYSFFVFRFNDSKFINLIDGYFAQKHAI